MQLDYIDLMLLHQPFNDYYGAWRALEDLYDEGKIRAIGVSNFYPDRLVDIASFSRIRPMVNQVETHPLHQQIEAHKWMEKYNIVHEAWAPFGEGRGGLFENPVLKEIGAVYGKTTAQVMLRWLLQRNIVVLAKSARVERMAENIAVFRNLTPMTPFLSVVRFGGEKPHGLWMSLSKTIILPARAWSHFVLPFRPVRVKAENVLKNLPKPVIG